MLEAFDLTVPVFAYTFTSLHICKLLWVAVSTCKWRSVLVRVHTPALPLLYVCQVQLADGHLCHFWDC